MANKICVEPLVLSDDVAFECFKSQGHKGKHRTIWNLRDGRQVYIYWEPVRKP
jgi:hypothetical protein